MFKKEDKIMRKRPNVIYLQLLLLIVALLLTAFTTYAAVSAKALEPNAGDKAKEPPEINVNLQTSAEINYYIKNIKGVSDSVCLVMFDQCYITIKCEDLVTKDAIESLKKEVKKSVLEKFDKIGAVFVTNDINAFVKLDSVVKRLNAGEKITDMKKELMELKKFFYGPKNFRHLKKRK